MEQFVPTNVSPEMIQAFEGMEAVALLGLALFVLLVIVIPVTLYFILKNHAKDMKMIKDAFESALDRRDRDHDLIIDTIHKLNDSFDQRLSSLEIKVDRMIASKIAADGG